MKKLATDAAPEYYSRSIVVPQVEVRVIFDSFLPGWESHRLAVISLVP
jgi:hypothetical protein